MSFQILDRLHTHARIEKTSSNELPREDRFVNSRHGPGFTGIVRDAELQAAGRHSRTLQRG